MVGTASDFVDEGGAPRRGKRASALRIAVVAGVGSAALIALVIAAVPTPPGAVDEQVDRVIELHGQGRRDDARNLSEQLCRDHADSLRVWLARGMIEEDRDDLSAAEDAYAHARRVMPAGAVGSEDIDISVADIHRRRGDVLGALRELDQLRANGAESGRLNHARALVLLDMKRFDDALREVNLLAEKRGGGGVARQLDKQIRQAMKMSATRDG